MSGDDVRNVPGKSTHGHSLYGSRDPDDNSCILWNGWKTFMYRAVIFRLLSLLAEGSWQILRDYFHMPFPYSMAAGIFLPFFTLIRIRKREEKEQFLYPVTLRFHGKEKKVQALWDSGNQLTQPVTGRPGTYTGTGSPDSFADCTGKQGTADYDGPADCRAAIWDLFTGTLSEYWKKIRTASRPATG